MIYFVLPNIKKESLYEDSIYYGFTFGIIVYGVFDFTSATIFKEWNMNLAIIDTLWGGFLYFISSYYGIYLANKYK